MLTIILTEPKEKEKLPVEEKQIYQRSIFPQKLIWGGENYRTPVLLGVLEDIHALNSVNVSPERLERSTTSLRGKCSTIELRAQGAPGGN